MQSGSFEVGDMVKFERGAYDHWGVYIGGGEIVHIGPEGTDEELNSLKLAFQGETKAAFKRDPLKRIAGNSCYYAHNYLDHKHTVRLGGGILVCMNLGKKVRGVLCPETLKNGAEKCSRHFFIVLNKNFFTIF